MRARLRAPIILRCPLPGSGARKASSLSGTGDTGASMTETKCSKAFGERRITVSFRIASALPELRCAAQELRARQSARDSAAIDQFESSSRSRIEIGTSRRAAVSMVDSSFLMRKRNTLSERSSPKLFGRHERKHVESQCSCFGKPVQTRSFIAVVWCATRSTGVVIEQVALFSNGAQAC